MVLGAQSQLPERPGFVVGVLAAVLMSSVAKHIACLEEKIVEKGWTGPFQGFGSQNHRFFRNFV